MLLFLIILYLYFQLFKGIFYYCDGPSVQKLQVKNKDDCLAHSGSGHKWVNHKYNFDNLGQALMSLFVLSSKDGWVTIMYQGLDAVGIDQQVIRYLETDSTRLKGFSPLAPIETLWGGQKIRKK